MRYWPASLETAARVFSMSAGLVASTVTPGSTAPVVSRTMLAIALWASAALGTTRHASTTDAQIRRRWAIGSSWMSKRDPGSLLLADPGKGWAIIAKNPATDAPQIRWRQAVPCTLGRRCIAPVSRDSSRLHLEQGREQMNRTVCAALVLAACLTTSLAAAQDAPTVVLSPADPSRWDAAVHVGWLGENKSEIAPNWNQWYDAASFGASAGYYWTPHLKLDVELGTTTK